MDLVKFGLKNFRGFGNKLEEITVNNFTCLIGKNDAGKSSIFDAMDVFFNGYQNIDADDTHIDIQGNKADQIELIGTFDTKDAEIKIESVPTSLEDEGLVNEAGQLEIVQYITSPRKTGIKTFIVAFLPDFDEVKDIHTLKNSDLKKRFKEIKENNNISSWDDISQTTNTLMRKAIITYYKNTYPTKKRIPVNVPIDKDGGKDLWSSISKSLPLFQLFKTDRDNNDSDAEIQNPLKAITKKTLQGKLQEQLNAITSTIKEETIKQANKTLQKLNEMDPELAKQITPKFDDPSWQNVFKFSLATDQIPLNKRGSGTRRLILLNFFRAEAEQAHDESTSNNIIYAFEEPETAQHIDHQKILMESFKKISAQNNQQVLITTHSSELAGLTDVENIREITQSLHISQINNSPELLKISDELGIFPNIPGMPGKLRMVIFVEGPNDVKFLRLFLSKYCSSFCTQNDLLVIPFGGGALKHWVDLNVLESLNPCTYYLFDNDDAGKSYASTLNKGRERVYSHTWDLGPIEFYFPYETYLKEVTSINKSRQNTDPEDILSIVSEDDYHHANYKKDIQPIKNALWSNFKNLVATNTLADYWSNDSLIDSEFKELALELQKCYSAN
mgnify:CR=1 FL=1